MAESAKFLFIREPKTKSLYSCSNTNGSDTDHYFVIAVNRDWLYSGRNRKYLHLLTQQSLSRVTLKLNGASSISRYLADNVYFTLMISVVKCMRPTVYMMFETSMVTCQTKLDYLYEI
jgi:hypothetical protein